MSIINSKLLQKTNSLFIEFPEYLAGGKIAPMQEEDPPKRVKHPPAAAHNPTDVFWNFINQLNWMSYEPANPQVLLEEMKARIPDLTNYPVSEIFIGYGIAGNAMLTYLMPLFQMADINDDVQRRKIVSKLLSMGKNVMNTPLENLYDPVVLGVGMPSADLHGVFELDMEKWMETWDQW